MLRFRVSQIMSEIQNQKPLAGCPKIIAEATDSICEQFQNNTLLTILNQQNEGLLRTFHQYIIRHKDTFRKLSANNKGGYIKKAAKHDRTKLI